MTGRLAQYTAGAPLDALRALAAPGSPRVWLVGGIVRDALLDRPRGMPADYDLTLDGDARALARALARAAHGHAFQLSGEFGAWRVRDRSGRWQVDLMPLAGGSLEQDLRRRDLTINAIAAELDGETLIDPCGGAADLTARRLRAVSDEAFSADPVRVMRLARLHAELGFEAAPATVALAAASAPSLAAAAPERLFQELRRLIVADGVLAGLALFEQTGASARVLPELTALHGVRQSAYHHLDVHDHTLAALARAIELVRDPSVLFGAQLADGLRALLAEPLADELTRGQALRFGALLHDIAKPQTRVLTASGRIAFRDHDLRGQEQAAGILRRLRASERLAAHVGALTRWHLRLGFLVHERPLSRRAAYRYLRDCAPVEVDVTLLSVADRLATLGRGAREAVHSHLELARELLPDALAYHAHTPKAPLRGDELARALGLKPGPALGRLLEELTEAAYAGEVRTPAEAVIYARAALARACASASG